MKWENKLKDIFLPAHGPYIISNTDFNQVPVLINRISGGWRRKVDFHFDFQET